MLSFRWIFRKFPIHVRDSTSFARLQLEIIHFPRKSLTLTHAVMIQYAERDDKKQWIKD